MNWKENFKPTKLSVTLTILFSSFVLFVLLTCSYATAAVIGLASQKPLYCSTGFLLNVLFYPAIALSILFGAGVPGLLVVIIAIILESYLISSAVARIFRHRKKK